jgi:polysaccharide chain length determinant protein (PEP-CTERM system associated)
MHDILVQLLRYARGVWRFRWWMLGIAWVICVIGWTVIARLPDQYEASARVYVDTQSVLRPLLRGLAVETGNTERTVSLMTRTLLSQPNLEKVLRMTDLDLNAQTDAQRDALLTELRGAIQLRGGDRENLYTITHTHDSPELAKLVVKSLLTLFMESNLGEVRKDQDSATQFLEQQIAEYARRMREMEANITRFKQRNLGYLPNETGGYYERIRDLQQQGDQAALELKIAQDRAGSLRAQLEGEEPTFGLGPQVRDTEIQTSAIDARIAAAESRLDEMLLRYTEKHPDVVATRVMLEDLQRQKRQEIAEARRELAKLPSFADSNESPYVQQLRISLSQAEAEIAAKKVLVDEYQSRAAMLKDDIERVLRVEAEQQQLTQDYQVLKTNHDSLVARLEAAKLARRADTSSDTVQFRVIDPPYVPSKPSGPQRVLLSAAVLFVGLGAGFAVAFLLSQVRPTFDERQMLNEELALPVLGSVNMVWTQDQIRARRTRNLTFLVSLGVLVGAFGMVVLLYQVDLGALPRLADSVGVN